MNKPSSKLTASPVICILCCVFCLSILQLFIHHPNNLAKDDVDYLPWRYDNPNKLVYPHTRFRAAFYTFVKGDRDTLNKLRKTIRDIEDRFNRHYQYPYIIFSNEKLGDEYRELTSSLVNSTMRFEKVGKEFYGYESTTDLTKAAKSRIELNGTMFGDSEDYRFQSRFMAGTVFR